ncbi:pyrroline-5-carboxylate reductase [Rhizobium rhizosphaerae]|uniref:Pyrroline-5-carboxylate reductase n=1 Tax=Xaviernesmea rhizosphaerae TaxID=1672749 RepID=A0A1Q9AIV5_9HYPH|nr:pyrroline-5-carboxylate reductase [Xaviernesmea rhizosphaerae]OLP55138.1 pyrroline-5-carboxylate reductase [Xaviernesmea rhizosphaerae]
MRLGFVGTGTITEAIVTGLCTGGSDDRITVSPRNAERAAQLAAAFPEVSIASDNQTVVDAGADMLFLAIRPQVAEAVIRPLTFSPGQTVVSLVAAMDRESLLSWIGVDVTLVQAIPLPFVARRDGVTAIYPGNEQVSALFDRLGRAVPCDRKEEYDVLAAASAIMGTTFGVMERLTGWMQMQGMRDETARAYLAPLFSSLAQTALSSPDMSFTALREEFSTRGGLNEQVFRDFDTRGGTQALTEAMDRVLARIRTGIAPQD